jgi:hypothetical protein
MASNAAIELALKESFLHLTMEGQNNFFFLHLSQTLP